MSLCRIALKHNYISSLLVIAGGVLALHYKTLTKVYAGCPVVVCVGPSETGKSTAIKAALSLFGLYFNSLVHCDHAYTMSINRVTIHGDICEGDERIFLGACCNILAAILYWWPSTVKEWVTAECEWPHSGPLQWLQNSKRLAERVTGATFNPPCGNKFQHRQWPKVHWSSCQTTIISPQKMSFIVKQDGNSGQTVNILFAIFSLVYVQLRMSLR